jgi:hypothetical protein
MQMHPRVVVRPRFGLRKHRGRPVEPKNFGDVLISEEFLCIATGPASEINDRFVWMRKQRGKHFVD